MEAYWDEKYFQIFEFPGVFQCQILVVISCTYVNELVSIGHIIKHFLSFWLLQAFAQGWRSWVTSRSWSLLQSLFHYTAATLLCTRYLGVNDMSMPQIWSSQECRPPIFGSQLDLETVDTVRQDVLHRSDDNEVWPCYLIVPIYNAWQNCSKATNSITEERRSYITVWFNEI